MSSATTDLQNTLKDGSTMFQTATETIMKCGNDMHGAIDNLNINIDKISNSIDGTMANVNTTISNANSTITSTNGEIKKISNNVNKFIDQQKEEFEKTEKLLQIIFIALACLVVVGIIALIASKISQSRKKDRQNEILQQIANNTKNNSATSGLFDAKVLYGGNYGL